MSLPSSRRRSFVRAMLPLIWLVFWVFPVGAAAQDEPSPIAIKLLAPPEAGPGQVIDVLIEYDATDLNAGADIIYNLSGPGYIWAREPEPPNPLVNIWTPGREMPKGTIKVQVSVGENSEGQRLEHLVEVRWGVKVQRFEAETLIKHVPPTATPTSVPRPRASPTPSPEPMATPARPTLSLAGAAVLSPELGETAISTAETNQEIAFQATYVSSGDVENVTALVRFEPDVVNLEGAPWNEEGYAIRLDVLPAAPGGAKLFPMPIQGRIRPWAEGGKHYELRALVQLSVPDGATANVPGEVASQTLDVIQSALAVVDAGVETAVVKAGGSIIVHATCTNLGPIAVEGVRLQLAGLPEGYVLSPDELIVDRVAANGGSEERVFTIRVPEDRQEQLVFRAVATLYDQVTESQPLTVQVVPPASLRLEVSADNVAVRARETFYVEVVCTNDGFFVAEDVEAKLVDTTGNLGVLLQQFGDIQPGQSIERVFAVTAPDDFPIDVVSTLVVRTASRNGALAESAPLVVEMACVPKYEIAVQPPRGQLEGGQSVEAIVVLRNASQCVARDLLLSIEDLPEAFIAPPAQGLAELAPGGTRYLTYTFFIPEGYQGNVSFTVLASDSTGVRLQAPLSSFSVSGVSAVFTIVFGVLFLVALSAIIVGLVLYFRHR